MGKGVKVTPIEGKVKSGKGFNEIGFDVKLPYEPYTDDLEVGTAFNRVDGFMTDVIEDEAFMKIRVKYGLLSSFLCLLGIFLVIFARAEVIIFQSNPRLVWLEVIGYVLCAPIICWFMYMCCPSREEKERRRIIKAKRKLRLKTYVKEEAKMIEETEIRKRERLSREQKNLFLSAEAKAAAFRANPLGYNIDNRKCHNTAATLQAKDTKHVAVMPGKSEYKA